jgi:hypothetical protein
MQLILSPLPESRIPGMGVAFNSKAGARRAQAPHSGMTTGGEE